MKKGLVLVLVLVLVLCFVFGSDLFALSEIPEGEYTVGEKSMQKGVDALCSIYRLWPGDGTRDDDPFKGRTEDTKMGIQNVSAPSMMVVRPEKADGRAVVLFPGGGYNFLAAGHEGIPAAKWLAGQGITVFLVKYRCPPREEEGARYVSAIQDVQRAIRLVRKNAKTFGIKKKKIGVMGFSAGAHLSVLLCHNHATDSYKSIDKIDKVSSRPDFAILVYPAIVFWGKQLMPSLRDAKKTDIPMYITIAADDEGCAKGTKAYVENMKKLKAPVSFHLFPKGGHGGGLKGFAWPPTCEEWLRNGMRDSGCGMRCEE